MIAIQKFHSYLSMNFDGYYLELNFRVAIRLKYDVNLVSVNGSKVYFDIHVAIHTVTLREVNVHSRKILQLCLVV